MKQPLAIVGASARAAAASALRAGFQPITADLFADLDLRAMATATRIAPYPDGLLDWLRTVEPPAWMYTGALENHPELIDQMAWLAPLWGNPGDVLARVRSPWQLGAALQNAGLLFPETRPTADGLPRDGTWLAKTYRSASGSGVTRFPLPFREGPGEGSEFVYQRRVPGIPCAAVFVAAAGAATLLGVTRQLVGEPWLKAHEFQYAGSIGPLALDKDVLATIERCGNILAAEFDLVGLFGVDFIFEGEHVWTLEVNPRYVASTEIIERATGLHALAAHAAACSQAESLSANSLLAPRSSQLMYGKAFLFAKRDLVVGEPFAAMALAEASRQPWPTLADVSAAGTPIDVGRPVLTIFAEGASVHEVENRLQERVALLERELYPD